MTTWRPLRSIVLAALVLAFLPMHAHAQGSAGEDPNGTQRQGYRVPLGATAQQPTASDLQREQGRFADQQHDRLLHDVQILRLLSHQLQKAVGVSTDDAISPDVQQLSAKMEKLAKKIRGDMAGGQSTALPPPAAAENLQLDQLMPATQQLDVMVRELEHSVDASGLTISVDSEQTAAEIQQLAARIKRFKSSPPAAHS